MITDDRVEKSIIYMAESDEGFALAYAKAKNAVPWVGDVAESKDDIPF